MVDVFRIRAQQRSPFYQREQQLQLAIDKEELPLPMDTTREEPYQFMPAPGEGRDIMPGRNQMKYQQRFGPDAQAIAQRQQYLQQNPLPNRMAAGAIPAQIILGHDPTGLAGLGIGKEAQTGLGLARQQIATGGTERQQGELKSAQMSEAAMTALAGAEGLRSLPALGKVITRKGGKAALTAAEQVRTTRMVPTADVDPALQRYQATQNIPKVKPVAEDLAAIPETPPAPATPIAEVSPGVSNAGPAAGAMPPAPPTATGPSGKAMIPTGAELAQAGKSVLNLPYKIGEKATELGGRLTQQSTQMLASRGGEEGIKLGRSFHEVADVDARLRGAFHAEANKVWEGLKGQEEIENAYMVAKGLAKPLNMRTQLAAQRYLKFTEKTGRMAEKAGLEVKGAAGEMFKRRQAYTADKWSDEAWDAVKSESGPKWDQMVNWLANYFRGTGQQYAGGQLGKAKTPLSGADAMTQATEFMRQSRTFGDDAGRLRALSESLKQAPTKVPGSERAWQYHRAIPWDRDIFLSERPEEALFQHASSVARRLAEAKVWGADYGNLRQWTDIAAKNAGQGAKDIDATRLQYLTDVANLVAREGGYSGQLSKAGKAANLAQQITGTGQLSGLNATIGNAIFGASANVQTFGFTPTIVGYIKAIGKTITKGNVNAYRESGILEHSLVDDMIPSTGEGAWKFAREAATTPFRMVEATNRMAAAEASKVFKRPILRKKGIPSDVVRLLTSEEGTFTPEELTKINHRGYFTAAESDKLQRAGVRLTQYYASARNLPMGWSTTAGSTFTQFMKMAYKQTQHTVARSLKELGYGNPKPLARFMVAATGTAMGREYVRDMLSGRKPSKDDRNLVDRIMRAAGDATGVIGVPLRFFQANSPDEFIANFAPAFVGPLADIGFGAGKMIRGKLGEDEEMFQRGASQALRAYAPTREVFGQVERAKQSRPSELGWAVQPDKKETAEYYRGKLANAYRGQIEGEGKEAALEVRKWGQEKGVKGRETKAAKQTVRSELYDEMYKAWVKGRETKDFTEYRRIKKQIKQMGATDRDIEDSKRSRRKEEQRYK